MSLGESVIDIFIEFERIRFVRILAILLASWLLIRLIERLLPWLAERLPGQSRLRILPYVPLLRLVILLAAISLIVPMVIKPSFQNVIAILGAVGVALGFAVKDYVSALVSGILAVIEHPYRPGDWVEISGVYGELKSMNLRALRLLTPDDTLVTIPHSLIWNHPVHNANSGSPTLMCIAQFHLDPSHNAAIVREKLHDVAITSPFIQLDKPITVVLEETPWGTRYRLKAYPIDGRDQFAFTSDLTERGKAALLELGVRPARALPPPPA